MKFNFNINSERATEHKLLLAVAGVFVFINVLEVFKSGAEIDVKEKLPIVTTSVDAMSGTVSNRVTKWQNPSLPFWKRYLCRGLQRSEFCSSDSLAPAGPDFEDPLDPATASVKREDRVIYYRGEMSKNSVLSSRLESPEAEVPPAKLLEVR